MEEHAREMAPRFRHRRSPTDFPSRGPWQRALILLLVAFAAAFVPVSGSHALAQQEEGPFSDGCYYVRQGNAYTLARCPQTDGSDYYYEPDGQGGWPYVMQCSATPTFTACLFVMDLYLETYPDGSTYMENSSRAYAISHRDGTVAEYGSYDANGQQRSTWYTGKNSLAMRDRSGTYWAVYGITVQAIVRSNPTAFDGLVQLNYGNDYMNCLHLNDSGTEFDYDGWTGFSELAEYCSG